MPNDKYRGENIVTMPTGEERERRLSSKNFTKKKENTNSLFLEAEKFYTEGGKENIKKAKEIYEQILELDPKHEKTLINLGTIFFNEDNLRKAIECYKMALLLNPDYPLAYYNISKVYDKFGNKEKAIDYLLTAIKLKPDYADAHYELAFIANKIEDYPLALKHFKRYLELDTRPDGDRKDALKFIKEIKERYEPK